ncbi:MAG: hypothetical protein K2F74_03370, partial [Muribaculaceae bacterium]|nr:hypothetical protein [Muribaculaceae bacterium]
ARQAYSNATPRLGCIPASTVTSLRNSLIFLLRCDVEAGMPPLRSWVTAISDTLRCGGKDASTPESKPEFIAIHLSTGNQESLKIFKFLYLVKKDIVALGIALYL